ncbi:MAG: branched-chain amino acid transaminase [Proteobacteria bacterium]|nr:branched-chain amino acid transaminase [Pseudomonadota bacterium]NBY20208.1 branched-chain amino acid transaminase [bacterium]
MAKKSNADSQFIWMDGQMVPYNNATTHVLSHSLHYGGAIFEGLRAYATPQGPALFRPQEHFERFLQSIKVMGYSISYSTTDLIRISHELIAKNNFPACYVRPVAYIDDSVRGLKLPPSPEVHTAIAVWPWGKYMGDEGHLKGVKVKTSTFRRPDVASSLPLAKISGAYLTSVLARREATLDGFDEAILLDPQGFVAEGSGENIFIVKDSEIMTPSVGYLLPGITRDCVIQIAKYLGFTLREEAITRNQLYLADEAFFTGTAVEVTPITEVDHLKIGLGHPGPITQKIKETFFKCTQGQVDPFKNWVHFP